MHREPPRVRIRTGWGMLGGQMSRMHAIPSLFTALLAVPLVAGCAVLGLPPTGDALDAQPAAGIDGDLATAGPEASPSFFSSNDGYALTLPAGWVGIKTNGNASGQVLDLLSTTDATLGDEAAALIDDTGARMSMLGAESEDVGTVPVPAGLAILLFPADGASDSETQKRIAGLVNGLALVDGPIDHAVISVAAGDAHRYDLTVQGDVLSIQLRLYLFTVGDEGVLIVCGRDASLATDTWPDVDLIIKSLRFGV
jgi:hypothetical protein